MAITNHNQCLRTSHTIKKPIVVNPNIKILVSRPRLGKTLPKMIPTIVKITTKMMACKMPLAMNLLIEPINPPIHTFRRGEFSVPPVKSAVNTDFHNLTMSSAFHSRMPLVSVYFYKQYFVSSGNYFRRGGLSARRDCPLFGLCKYVLFLIVSAKKVCFLQNDRFS